jgi:hypothetical protein
MKNLLLLISVLLSIQSVFSQTPYTQPQFGFEKTTDIEYGTAVNYAGTNVSLLMDIYKPIGDFNCNRPIMILAHGGSWVTDSKENASMVFMSEELAKRGWVVANIDYRLGTNKTDTYNANAFCTSVSEPCAFINDSLEIPRANYRAMQDAKGAIRYMKSRNLIDSTDINNVFMAGESAGGFIALAAGFTNDISKKPTGCGAVGDAPTPDPDLAALPCSDPNNDLSRPDLGGIDGTLHLGTYNANLQGVGSFFGGVLDLNLFNNISNPPSVYLFCQGADVIIHYDYGVMFERISDECFSGICQSYGPYPHAYGGEGIKNHFVTLGTTSPDYHDDIVYNFAAGNNCLDNGHQIDSANARLQSITDYFAQKIAASGNSPSNSCTVGISANPDHLEVYLLGNFIDESINIKLNVKNIGAQFTLTDLSGKNIASGILNNEKMSIDLSNSSSGMYLLNIYQGSSSKSFKVIKK